MFLLRNGAATRRCARLFRPDTGIRAKGWSKAQAVASMLDNTAFAPANIEAEVNRYIANRRSRRPTSWMSSKIREMRSRTERELGARFDLRRFHDAVLGQGSVPLDALNAQITAWIAGEKG